MKKIFLTITLLGLVCLFLGCEKKDNAKEELQLEFDKDISMTIKEGTLSKTSATVIITDKSGKNNIYSSSFRLEKKENDKWVALKPTANYDWTLMGFHVNDDNQLELVQNWEDIYGELEVGDYRLIKTTLEPLEDKSHFFAVEFTYNTFEIIDTSREKEDFICDDKLEEIYFDEAFNGYYLPCNKSQYIEVRYSDGTKEDVKTALKEKNIKIEDLDRFKIEYIKKHYDDPTSIPEQSYLSCLESQLGAYITSEITVPYEIPMSKIISTNLTDIEEAKLLTDNANRMFAIFKTSNSSIVEEVNQYFDKQYPFYQMAKLTNNYYIYTSTGTIVDFENILNTCGL